MSIQRKSPFKLCGGLALAGLGTPKFWPVAVEAVKVGSGIAAHDGLDRATASSSHDDVVQVKDSLLKAVDPSQVPFLKSLAPSQCDSVASAVAFRLTLSAWRVGMTDQERFDRLNIMQPYCNAADWSITIDQFRAGKLGSLLRIKEDTGDWKRGHYYKETWSSEIGYQKTLKKTDGVDIEEEYWQQMVNTRTGNNLYVKISHINTFSASYYHTCVISHDKVLEEDKEVLLLTLHVGEKHDNGSTQITCTAITGEEVATVIAHSGELVFALRLRVREDISQSFRLMLPDGRVLRDGDCVDVLVDPAPNVPVDFDSII